MSGEPNDLELEIVLIRPEPWNTVVGLMAIRDREPRCLALVLGVLDRLQPEPAIRKRL